MDSGRIRVDSYKSEHEFAYGVDKDLDKLLVVREATPDKIITFVHLQPAHNCQAKDTIAFKIFGKALNIHPK